MGFLSLCVSIFRSHASYRLNLSQTGLFSASVASLISISIQDIQQNPQNISNFYLANTYQATINPNVLGSLPSSPPPFIPPNYAVWVNALWFLSFVISLTCALFATFLQQWARRYLKLTQSRYCLHRRARIRAFFAEGVEKYHLPWVVETLPILLHISLFLFFAGLVVFLSNVNLTIFKLVLSWVAVCAALYGCITLMPIIRHDSPYYTSLSSLLWPIVTSMALFVSALSGLLLYCTVFGRRGADWLFECVGYYYNLFSRGMQKTAQETALKSSSEIDTRAFMWTFESLDDDDELERFFSGLPGFRSSKFIHDPLPDLLLEEVRMLGRALRGLLDRTLSSDFLPESVKIRRVIMCAKAFDLKHFPHTFYVLDSILSQFQYSGTLATGFMKFLRGWRINQDECTVIKAQALISKTLVKMQPRDDTWFILASDELGVPKDLLRDYAAHGDSLSLAILIHVARQQFTHAGNGIWPRDNFSEVLEATSKFDVQDTSPELQHEFCALWNQIVRKGQKNHDQDMAWLLLRPIRNIYITLHQDTDSVPTQFSASTPDLAILEDPSSYPVCNVHDHHPNSTAHIHDDPDSASMASARLALPDHDNPALKSFFHFHSPGTTSASAHAPLRVDEGRDAPPLNNHTLLPVQSTSENRRISSTREHTDSSAPVFDDMLPTGLVLPSDSAVAGSGHAFSLSESPSMMLAPTSRLQSGARRSAPELDAAAEREGTKSALSVEEGTVHPSSEICDDITATPSLPPQSPSPLPINRAAITDLSQSSLDAEYREDHRRSVSMPHVIV